MPVNNNLSVIPWYTSIDEQNHLKSYAYGNIYPLFAPVNLLLPFQILRTKNASFVLDVSLYTSKGVFVKSILSYMVNAGLTVIRDQSTIYDVIVFPGYLPMPLGISIGQYYMRLSDGSNTWYSDIITLVDDVTPYLKIEWYDYENAYFDAGLIVYKTSSIKFKNILYLCTELGKPEYVFEEEGETRDGYFFREKQISEKTYNFTFLASEYLCDVMRFIRMSDYIYITDKYQRKYKCDTFLITPKWQTQGDIASVEAEFQTDTVVKKIGKGYVINQGGDFNNDFNTDFNNTAPATNKAYLEVYPDNLIIVNGGGQVNVKSSLQWEVVGMQDTNNDIVISPYNLILDDSGNGILNIKTSLQWEIQ